MGKAVFDLHRRGQPLYIEFRHLVTVAQWQQKPIAQRSPQRLGHLVLGHRDNPRERFEVEAAAQTGGILQGVLRGDGQLLGL